MQEKVYNQLIDFYQAKLDGLVDEAIRDKDAATDLLRRGCIVYHTTFTSHVVITRIGVNEFFNADIE